MDTDIKDTKDIKDIKYIFQKYNYNSFQCGAYAIYNLLHHCRHVVDLDYLIENCKADKNYGTLVSSFNETITNVNSLLNLDITQMNEKELSTKTIKNKLNNNKPIIILFHWEEKTKQGNHYAIIDKLFYKNGNTKFRIINYSFEKPIHIISERELKSILIPYEDEHFKLPVAWHDVKGTMLKARC